VERLLDPSLRGKPVIVGGRAGERGVVTACSYEVRASGVRSGMSLTKASRLAPHAIFLPVRHAVYGDYAERVRDIAGRYSPIVQVASIDEMFIDFSGCEGLYRKPGDKDDDATIERTVRELTSCIHEELGLPSSAGIATSRSMAKVASGLAKPAGVKMVRAGEEEAILAPLPVRKLPGIGPVAEGKLAALGIKTLGDLSKAPQRRLKRVFGAWAEHVSRGARGLGSEDLGRDHPAFQEHDPEGETIGSISNERTFHEDVYDEATTQDMLCSLCERVCYRARKRRVVARTISLKLRYADFKTLSRSKTLSPSASELDLYPVVLDLYRAARTRPLPLRLLGLALSNLSFESPQLELFDDHDALHEGVDAVRERYGFDSLRLAGSKSQAR
jgi:DNA polymerase-4